MSDRASWLEPTVEQIARQPRASSREQSSPEPPLPSLATQARNFAVAVTGHVVAGLPEASSEAQEARRGVCERGEGLGVDQVVDGHCDRYRPSDSRCAACGCFVPAKLSWAEQRCPLGRWPA